MKYKLVVKAEAEKDIEEAFEWYESQVAGLGNEFVYAVRAAMESIADRPLSFPVALSRTRRVVLVRFPYSVFFTISENVITVTACVHQRRHPRVWKSRYELKANGKASG